MAAATKLSAKEAAAELGTDARTLRKFIRASADKGTLPVAPCGQGNRYEFTSKDIKALKKVFIAWTENSTKKAEKPSKVKSDPEPMTHAPAIGEVDDDPLGFNDAEIEEITDLEPSDDDLAEIEEIDLDIELDD